MRNWWIVLIVLFVLGLVCCVTALCFGSGIALWFANEETSSSGFENFPPFEETVEVFPNDPDNNDGPTPEQGGLPTLGPRPTRVPPTSEGPATDAAQETLNTLEEAEVPNNEPNELAQRLGGVGDIPETVPVEQEYQVGDSEQFWVNSMDTDDFSQVDAVLRYETEHVYFWVQEGVKVNDRAMQNLVETFENEVYPTNREFFGSEFTPGIDNDPHLNILYTRGMGSSVAGYFSSSDSLHPLASDYSNAREMFMLSADNTALDEEFTYGVLAHEFQHMIHWYQDRNEESWLNEGFSELAAFLNGFDPGGFDYLYATDPDLQLNDWPNDDNATTPYYGSSFLFVTYFLDRFGEEATRAVVSNEDNGLDSVDAVLAGLDETNPSTGETLTADDVFADWVLANFLKDDNVGDGRFTYSNYPDSPQTFDTEQIDDCDGAWEERDVHQYGVDYIRLSCDGPVTLNFLGNTEVGVLAENAHSGDYAFWSNKGDESDMKLDQTFDFTSVDGPIELSYWTWYDLEEGYDYLFLSSSTDGGETWQIIETPSCTSEDPSGNSYGCGYNGTTNGWQEEIVDLSQFAGQEVTLRFEYITDAAVNGEGLMLDDMAIDAIDYQTDFEQDNGGWEPAGFVRIQNRLPQTYRVSLIRYDGREVSVEPLMLDDQQGYSLPLDFGGDLDEAVLVVSGTTRFTRQEAIYNFQLEP